MLLLRKTRWLSSVLVALAVGWIHPGTVEADVVVLYNGSPAAIEFTIEGEKSPRRQYRLVAADVVRDSLPGTYDAAVMTAFIQVLSPDDARRAI